MKLNAKFIDIDSAEPEILLNGQDAAAIGLKENDRINISGTRNVVAIVNISDTLVPRGEIFMPDGLMALCGVSNGEQVDVTYSEKPDSVRSIRRKMDGEVLTTSEISSIVNDIYENKLSKIEISA